MIDTLIGFLGALTLLGLLYLASLRGRWRTPDWVIRLSGGVPWAPGVARTMVAVPSDGRQPTHEVYFVARQDLAECGLICPKCDHDVAERADFSRVVRAVIDGQENEVIKCQGVIDLLDGQKPRPCPAWLAAAPNTEHGDDLIAGDPPEFYTFSRIGQLQALAEKYGVEIKPGEGGGLIADPKQRPAEAVFADLVPFAQDVRLHGVVPAPPTPTPVHPSEDETRLLPTITDPNKDM